MAHQIFEGSMAFAGTVPWHGLGQQLPKNATADEIVSAAKFYKVGITPMHVPGQIRPAPGVRALVREDTGQFLAAVGDRYEVVDAVDVAKTLVEAAEGVDAIFHTAGLLGERGERFWLLAELPRIIRVRGDKSEIRPFILGTSAHDGASPIVVMNVATRVVCANTLGTALGEKTQARWSIKHTKSAKLRLEEAARGFQQMARGMEHFEQLANVLATTRFTDSQIASTLDTVIPLPDDGKEHARLENSRAKVVQLFEAGLGMQGIRGTAWGALQAWTEFADHHRGVRGAEEGNERAARLESVWLGGAATLKQRALNAIALETGLRLAA